MLCLVLGTVFSIVAAATKLQDTVLVPASHFSGHKNTQVPSVARDVLNTLLNRQVTCDPGYGLCPNGGCCPSTDNCCSNADLCVEVGGSCCNDNLHTCPPDWNCCGGYCSPVGGQCCTTGYYCPDGWWCVLYSGAQYCCYGLSCTGTYNPQYHAVPTITANNLQTPTNAAGGGSASAPAPTGGSEPSSTYLPPPGSSKSSFPSYPATEPPSATTPAVVYKNYYFTVTWSYESYYYTGTAEYGYTWQMRYDSTTVSFYCSDYDDAGYSADMYSLTEDFPTPTAAALPSFTNSAVSATASGIGATATASGGSGVSSTGGPVAGALRLWQDTTARFLGFVVMCCVLLHLVF